jgi:hypothetical protein
MTRGQKDRSNRSSLFSDFFVNAAAVPRNLSGSDRVDSPPTGQTDRAGQEMSRLMMGLSGALALALISGAAEYARGHDLSSRARDRASDKAPLTQGLASQGLTSQGLASQGLGLPAPADGASLVNRGSKADRAAVSTGSAASTRTVSVKLDAFADTTFLIRLPVAIANRPSPPAQVKPALRKSMVACEPVVSILTDVAKQLQPGRCVT